MSTHRITSNFTETDRLGMAIAGRLSEGLNDLPHDISERLRAGRMRALANRKQSTAPVLEVAAEISRSGGAATLNQGDQNPSWWAGLANLVPLIALVVGLISIVVIQDEIRVRELAEVDAELLTDELPPAAYVDPGFAQFVRSNRSN